MFVDLQLARLQCDGAGLTDNLTSDSVVYGCTILGATVGKALRAE